MHVEIHVQSTITFTKRDWLKKKFSCAKTRESIANAKQTIFYFRPWLLISLILHIVWANSKGTGETARMCRLAWAFIVSLCAKYRFHMGWLKFEKKLPENTVCCNYCMHKFLLDKYTTCEINVAVYFRLRRDRDTTGSGDCCHIWHKRTTIDDLKNCQRKLQILRWCQGTRSLS